MESAAFKYVPQPVATTFALPSVWFLFYLWTKKRGGKMDDVKSVTLNRTYAWAGHRYFES